MFGVFRMFSHGSAHLHHVTLSGVLSLHVCKKKKTSCCGFFHREKYRLGERGPSILLTNCLGVFCLFQHIHGGRKRFDIWCESYPRKTMLINCEKKGQEFSVILILRYFKLLGMPGRLWYSRVCLFI